MDKKLTPLMLVKKLSRRLQYEKKNPLYQSKL